MLIFVKWFNNIIIYHPKHISCCYIFRIGTHILYNNSYRCILHNCIVHIIIIIISNIMFIIVTNRCTAVYERLLRE